VEAQGEGGCSGWWQWQWGGEGVRQWQWEREGVREPQWEREGVGKGERQEWERGAAGERAAGRVGVRCDLEFQGGCQRELGMKALQAARRQVFPPRREARKMQRRGPRSPGDDARSTE
jgi:hypothetical protein